MTSPPVSVPGPEFRRQIGLEIAAWEREGLVQPEQAQALRARYGLLEGETVQTLHQSRLVQVLSVLGVILVGVGVILFIGANWEQIPRWGRFALLFCATAAAYGGGYHLAYRTGAYPKVGMALLLLGSLLWGASIFLIWQIFHLGGTGPGQSDAAKALLYWFVGVLPLAYILRSPLHLALSLIVGSIWLGVVLSDLDAQPIAVVTLFLSVGVLLYALGRLHEGVPALGTLEVPYRWFGLLYLFQALYVFSYHAFWGEVESRTRAGAHMVDIVLLLGGAAALVLLLKEGNRSRTALAEGTALLVLALLGWLLMSPAGQVFAASHPYGTATGYDLGVMVLFNLLLLAAEVGLVALGWARRQPGLMNFGLFVFFVQVVTRYFDLLGTMLQGGLMFIGAGLLLVALGTLLERYRRTLLRSMQERGES
jgi:uncharacterized membrane protein